MPTILREGPYRFFFYSDEGIPREPPHVHVVAGEKLAKFWLEPVELASSKRFRASEIVTLRNDVERNRVRFLREWNAYFST